ncbi:MAG: LysR family transcriptional regulator [Reichenbachiella sp.]
MINLEWLRTFREVYKTKSLSQAADRLMISQPTVSQQISALESRVGKKLFDRKSKGVLETDMGRILNTMISGSLEELEGVEEKMVKKDAKFKNILSLGISPHLYKSMLCNKTSSLGEYLHIKFGVKNDLIKQVESGDLMYAVVHEKVNTFDTTCHSLGPQNMVLVGTPDIDFNEIKILYDTDKLAAQKWLQKHKWYAHDYNSNFIKMFWLNVFDKKRPSIVPNYVIPNEHEVLYQQSAGSGLSVAFDNVVKHFVDNGTLHTCILKEVNCRELYLVANKKKADDEHTELLKDAFSLVSHV